MDGKTKKILNYLKKSGGDAEALDISFGLNMDEDFVQNALDSLVQENLVTSARNEQGKILYNMADGDASPAPAPEKAPKKAKGKAVAGPEDHFDEFVLENEAVNVVTDTIATHIDDIAHAAAAPAPAPAAYAPPPAPSTAFFEVEDDFSAKPKKEKKPAAPPPPPPPNIDTDDDDFAPKPKKAKKPAPPPPDIDIDDDDFAPKPKKSRKQSADFDDDDARGESGPKAKLQVNLITTVAAAIVAIIVSVILSVAISGGKTKSAIAVMERDVVKTLDFETYKEQTEKDIKSLKAKNQALETKVKNLENKVKQDRPAAAAAARRPAARRGR